MQRELDIFVKITWHSHRAKAVMTGHILIAYCVEPLEKMFSLIKILPRQQMIRSEMTTESKVAPIGDGINENCFQDDLEACNSVRASWSVPRKTNIITKTIFQICHAIILTLRNEQGY